MDDELEKLEAELKRLTPAAISPELITRVGRQLAPGMAAPISFRSGTPERSWWLWSMTVPAAAALTILCSVAVKPRVTEARDVLKPVAAENVLYAATDEGLVTLEDGTPARRERLKYVDTITWQNPRTHASLTWTVPREEVRVVPVSYQ
jgi:hypothetical protein